MLGKKGFTLIELLVVIIIVGILAAVAVPVVRGNLKRAHGTEGIAALGAIRTAERVYHAEHNTYATVADAAGLSTIGLASSDLGGKYYSGSSVTVVAGSGGIETEFVAKIEGTGDAANEWVEMDQDGNVAESYAGDTSMAP